MITHFLVVMFQQLLQGLLTALDFVIPQILFDALDAIAPVLSQGMNAAPMPVLAIVALMGLHFTVSIGFSIFDFAKNSYLLIPFKAA